MGKLTHRRPRVKRVRKPVPIPPPKPKRPKRGELKSIYKGLLSVDIGQRVNTLAKAMAWYDKVQVYVIYKQEGKWTRTQLNAKNLAEMNRAAGIKTPQLTTKESRFTESIHAYEKLVQSYKPPKLSLVLKKLRSQKKVLDERQENMADKYGQFLKLVKEALHPVRHDSKPIKLRVGKLESTHLIDAEGNVTFDRNHVLHLRKMARKKGFLFAVQPLLPVLAEVYAREDEVDNHGHKTGRVIVDSQYKYTSVLMMFNNMIHYSQQPDGPRTLVRRLKSKED